MNYLYSYTKRNIIVNSFSMIFYSPFSHLDLKSKVSYTSTEGPKVKGFEAKPQIVDTRSNQCSSSVSNMNTGYRYSRKLFSIPSPMGSYRSPSR